MFHKLFKACALATPVFLLGAGAMRTQAGTTFNVSIDTASLVGTNGGIYLQFSPGLNSDPASVSISNFILTTPGSLTPNSALNFSDGGASGSLDNKNLQITNATALNDYGEALKFGDEISFDVTLNMPAVLKGNSGSELTVEVTGADLLTPLLTSDPSGNIVDIAYDQTGALNVLSTSNFATTSELIGVPEPSGYWMFIIALLWVIMRKRGLPS